MTPDRERQAWREAVRAFKLAATVLKAPAPRLFAELAIAEEDLRNLTQELPLVSFSPFGALPADIAGESLHRPARDIGRPSGRMTEHQVVTRGPRESAAQPPVFSFRRGSASDVPAGQRHPSRGDHDAPEHSTGESTAQEREEVVETGSDVSVHSTTRDMEVEHGTGYRSVYPMTLLDSLAEDALGTVEHGTPDAPVHPSETPGTGSVPSGERTVGSREFDRRVGHDYGAADHAPTEPGASRSGVSARNPAESPDLPVSGSGDLPEADPEAYGDSAAALVDSLAEQVLVPEARIDESLPMSRARGGGLAAPPDRSPFALSDGEADGQNPSDPRGVPEGVFPGHVDAETFAALVNEVLVRQARRHGVDLS